MWGRVHLYTSMPQLCISIPNGQVLWHLRTKKRREGWRMQDSEIEDASPNYRRKARSTNFPLHLSQAHSIRTLYAHIT